MLATPLVAAIILAALAYACALAGRRRMGRWIIVTACLIAYGGSTNLVGDALLGPLESRFPPFAESAAPPVSAVVVLGSSFSPRDGIPVTAALDPDGLARITEGVRLVRHAAGRRLVVSGGAPSGREPSAHGYALLAVELGMDASSVTTLARPLDTREESKEIAALIGNTQFVLVTSAYHMPRAVALMEQAGTHPIAAPTGHLVNHAARWSWTALLPEASGLKKTERALHEYLGLASFWLKLEED